MHRAPAAAYRPSADMPALLSLFLGRHFDAIILQPRRRPVADTYVLISSSKLTDKLELSKEGPSPGQAREPCVVSKEQN